MVGKEFLNKYFHVINITVNIGLLKFFPNVIAISKIRSASYMR